MYVGHKFLLYKLIDVTMCIIGLVGSVLDEILKLRGKMFEKWYCWVHWSYDFIVYFDEIVYITVPWWDCSLYLFYRQWLFYFIIVVYFLTLIFEVKLSALLLSFPTNESKLIKLLIQFAAVSCPRSGFRLHSTFKSSLYNHCICRVLL